MPGLDGWLEPGLHGRAEKHAWAKQRTKAERTEKQALVRWLSREACSACVSVSGGGVAVTARVSCVVVVCGMSVREEVWNPLGLGP